MTGERVFLGLGGNLGEPAQAMAAALRALDADAAIEVGAVSSLYRTPPWGKTDQPDFLNCVAEVRTSLSPRALIDACLAAERALKRQRLERWGPRVIDIDILTYGGQTVEEPGLQIPHPRMLQRAFVLVPLAEIAPELIVAGRSVQAWLAEVDTAGIDKMPGGASWSEQT